MNWIDLHCDALMKLALHPDWSFEDDERLDVNAKKLRVGGVRAQAFAIFVFPDEPVEKQFELAMLQVNCFYERVLKTPGMKHLKTWEDFFVEDDQIGAFLTLEGVGPIGNDLKKLDTLLDAGVLSVGLTWNPANLAADGIGEPRNGGLTQFGFEIVKRLNERRILCDVSHLSHQTFYDVLEHATYVIASHSNCFDICDHPRNLTDDQIKCMVKKKAPIHLVFNPPFVSNKEVVTCLDLIPHIHHLISLNAGHLIGMGSDFDGITEKLDQFTDWSQASVLEEALVQHFDGSLISGIQANHFLDYIRGLL